jgi:hypothetical protein
MKKKLLFTTAFAALAISFQAQTVVFASSFRTWLNGVPTGWAIAPANNIANTAIKIDSVGTLNKYAVNLTDTSSTTYVRFASAPFAISNDSAYMVTYSYRGKGDVRAGLYSGRVIGDSATGYGYTYSGTESSNKGSWTRVSQSIKADTSNLNGQVIFSVKETGTSTSTTTPVVTGIEIDSVVVTRYSPKHLSLFNVLNTINANSNYYGSIVYTGGIVTAVYSSGYYIQSSKGNTFCGAMVYDFNHVPAQGDSVTFSADVDEYYSNLELQTIYDYNVDTAGNHNQPVVYPLPAFQVLNVATMNNANTARPYQGMLVKLDNVQANTIAYKQWPLTDASAAAVVASSCTIGTQIFTAPIVVSAKYSFVQGPAYYDGDYNYEIMPRDNADIGIIINASVQNFSNSLVAKMYPNPVNDELTIDLSMNQEKTTVTVYDMLGKEVSSPLITSGNQIVLKNINLPAGVYMVKVLAAGQAQMMKFVKE